METDEFLGTIDTLDYEFQWMTPADESKPPKTETSQVSQVEYSPTTWTQVVREGSGQKGGGGRGREGRAVSTPRVPRAPIVGLVSVRVVLRVTLIWRASTSSNARVRGVENVIHLSVVHPTNVRGKSWTPICA